MIDSLESAASLNGIELKLPHFKIGPLHMSFPTGCITAIVGTNGSGKSTTFQMLLGLVMPDKGEAELLGHPVLVNDDEKLKQRIAYVPEEDKVMDERLKGSDKVEFVSRWYPNWDVNKYHELLRRFELDPNIRLGKMSKGMRRKLELAIALAHDPELLILDEPSSGLDPLAWKEMIGLLQSYMEDGNRTILMATHIIDEVRRLADYIVFMIQGRMYGPYEKDELFSSWQTFFIKPGEGINELASTPGLQELTHDPGAIRLVTNESAKAEGWLEEHGVSILIRQQVELDDILAFFSKKHTALSRYE